MFQNYVLRRIINLEWSERIGPVLSTNLFGEKISLCLCHRMTERSFKINNFVFPLCARCTGQIFGILPAMILFIFGFKLLIIVAFLLIIPMLIDGFTQMFLQRFSNNALRFVTGFFFSFGFLSILFWW
jgi:uncharacterized membrane protein